MKRKLAKLGCNQTKTVEETLRKKQIRELYKELGIELYYDLDNTIDSYKQFSKHYNTIEEYNKDKAEAIVLINEDKPIPEDLRKRLIDTKLELGR